MSETLARQIHDDFSYVDEVQGEVDVASVRERWVGEGSVLPLQPPTLRPRLSQHRWVATMIAAAAVFVLVGGFALLLRASGAGVPTNPTPPDSPSTPQGISQPGSHSVIGTWSRVPQSDAVLGEGQMISVAVGATVAGDEHGDAAVWSSVDGITWTRVLHHDSFTDQAMSGVVVAGGNLVAVGSSVWISDDGMRWTQVPTEDVDLGDGYMHDVTAGGPGLVAVGSGDNGAAVWTSVDGTAWQLVPHDEGMFRGSDSWIRSVTVGGPGLVAVGIDWSNPDADAAMWTSVDGIAGHGSTTRRPLEAQATKQRRV